MEFFRQIPPLHLLDLIFIGVTVLLIGISWYYFFGIFSRIRVSKSASHPSFPPVSIVIAARNELENLKQNLPPILAQDYPDFEVIIVDDGSFDGTGNYIRELMASDPRLQYSFLDPEHIKIRGKKIALTLAFKKARHPYFMLTDADCRPASDQWLKRISAQFQNDKQIVLGYSPHNRKPGILNSLIRLETIQTGMHYLGYASIGKPYMGVGRNLAYSREVYLSVSGFASHHHVPCGDDDLFVQEAASAKNVAICAHPEAYTYTEPKHTWSAWYRQKLRHLWAGKFYAPNIRNRLFWYSFAQFFFLPVIITWFFLASFWAWPLAAILLKLAPEWIIFGKKAKLLQGRDLIPLYPISRILLGGWMFITGTAAFFSKKPQW